MFFYFINGVVKQLIFMVVDAVAQTIFTCREKQLDSIMSRKGHEQQR